jgi:hypothetical protein
MLRAQRRQLLRPLRRISTGSSADALVAALTGPVYVREARHAAGAGRHTPQCLSGLEKCVFKEVQCVATQLSQLAPTQLESKHCAPSPAAGKVATHLEVCDMGTRSYALLSKHWCSSVGPCAAAPSAPGSGISTGYLTFKRDFNSVLQIQQGFEKGPCNSHAGAHPPPASTWRCFRPRRPWRNACRTCRDTLSPFERCSLCRTGRPHCRRGHERSQINLLLRSRPVA